MRCRGKGDAIPLLAVKDAPRLAAGSFTLIYVGELIYRKHQDYFFDIVDLMKNKIPRLKLLLVGNGSLMRNYVETIKKMNLDQYVVFLGYRKDVPALMALADVAVSSSRQEGLPVNIMEAMASGLPLVVSNCRGNRDLVHHDVNGFVFDLDKPEEFSSGIEQLFGSEELRKKFGANSLKIIERYSLSVVLSEMEKIYEKYL